MFIFLQVIAKQEEEEIKQVKVAQQKVFLFFSLTCMVQLCVFPTIITLPTKIHSFPQMAHISITMMSHVCLCLSAHTCISSLIYSNLIISYMC
jgi:hypothetical protein